MIIDKVSSYFTDAGWMHTIFGAQRMNVLASNFFKKLQINPHNSLEGFCYLKSPRDQIKPELSFVLCSGIFIICPNSLQMTYPMKQFLKSMS